MRNIGNFKMMKLVVGDWAPDTLLLIRLSMTGKPQFLIFATGFKHERVALREVTTLQIVNQENKTSILGKAGWGTAGLLVLGPLGAFAGLLGGGNSNQQLILLKLRDGRSAMLTAKSHELLALMKATNVMISTSEIPARSQIVESETTPEISSKKIPPKPREKPNVTKNKLKIIVLLIALLLAILLIFG